MKYALVTGAYGGMGEAMVESLLTQGYTIFALDKFVKEERENVIPVEADLTSLDSVKEAYAFVSSKTDHLDCIIHFAGIYMLDSLVEIPEEEYDRIVKINFYGPYYINKTFLPLMKKGSRIVITTSELAPLDPLPFTGIYAVTKGALDKYAYSLRMELQLLGIHVSVLRAGAVTTKMLGASTAALDRFCEKTTHYTYNAKRFHAIVDSVESKSVPPSKIATKVSKILSKKKPKFAYSINRNRLLLLLNILPSKLQFFAIRKVLEN